MAEGPECQCRNDDAVIGGAFGGTILEVTQDADGTKLVRFQCNDCGLPGVIRAGNWADILTPFLPDPGGSPDAA